LKNIVTLTLLDLTGAGKQKWPYILTLYAPCVWEETASVRNKVHLLTETTTVLLFITFFLILIHELNRSNRPY